MNSWEIGELTNFLIDLALFPILLAVLFKTRMLPRFGPILAAAVCIVASHAATLAEGFFLPRFFDALEHGSIAAAGVCFLFALRPAADRAEKPRTGGSR